MEMFIKQRLPAVTIVEYSDQKHAVNLYPDRIVSPPSPNTCCFTGMEPVGGEQRERGWLFLYVRCRQCGYTVRRFSYAGPPSLSLLSDVLGPPADAASESEDAAGIRVPRCLWQAEQGEGWAHRADTEGDFSGQLVGSRA